MGSYLRPARLDDALAALATGPRTILSGGTDLYPAHVGRTFDDDVLDVSALPDLRTISHTADRWRIPALATWTDLLRHDLPPAFDGLQAAARAVGGVQIQNRATICGNVCNASPAADGLPNLVALDASVELAAATERREVAVAEFMTGNRLTVRRPDELVTAVLVPDPVGPARSVFLKLGSRAYLVISIVSVAAFVEREADGRISRARVAVGACSAVPLRVPAVEARLIGRKDAAAAAAEVGSEDLAPLSPIDDVRATAAYRRGAALVLVRRAIREVAG